MINIVAYIDMIIPKMQIYFDDLVKIDGILNCLAMRRFLDLKDWHNIIDINDRSEQSSEQSEIPQRNPSIFSIGMEELSNI